VLVHGTSRVVAALLVAAAQNGQQFSVVQTESSGGPVRGTGLY
jgi:translation initiation factor 2B subunit (eIF-2B alpha/beta/delta family)